MSIETMSECFEMRLAKSVLDQVDTWRARQRDVPSRAEAIRRLVDAGLEADARSPREVRLTDGEKLGSVAESVGGNPGWSEGGDNGWGRCRPGEHRQAGEPK